MGGRCDKFGAGFRWQVGNGELRCRSFCFIIFVICWFGGWCVGESIIGFDIGVYGVLRFWFGQSFVS